jgi:hypothetical protein
MSEGMQGSGSELPVIGALRREFEHALEHETRRAPPRRGRTAGLAVAGALVLATASGAATGALDVGSEVPGGAPTGSHQRAEERVLALGEAPVAGQWRLTSYTSKEFVHDGEVVERAGLPCIRLMLVDQRHSPFAGSGWCAEIEDGFYVGSVPYADAEGRTEVVLFGIAPEGAAAVELSAEGGVRIQARMYEGPASFAGDAWVVAAPLGLRDATVDWVDGSGKPAGADLDASGSFQQARTLRRAVEPDGR